jgi:hypothetical protein
LGLTAHRALRTTLVCLVAIAGCAVLAACGAGAGHGGKVAQQSAAEIERTEAAAAKKQEAAEITEDRELLSGIESKKREEVAEERAKRTEAIAAAKAKKKEQAAAKAAKLKEELAEANIKKGERAAQAKAKAKAKREASRKKKEQAERPSSTTSGSLNAQETPPTAQSTE